MGSNNTADDAAAKSTSQENIDLDTVLPGKESVGLTLQTEPYDPLPSEDRARRNIAYLLIWLLIGICAATFFSVWSGAILIDDLVRILEILLGPVVALVSAATGFYYGTKAHHRTPKS